MNPDLQICPLYTPKHPPINEILEHPMKKASDQFADIQQDKYKMQNITTGRKLMQDLPFIELKEIVGMQPSQVMEYANTKFKQWEPSLPKMPCIYVYERVDGSIDYNQLAITSPLNGKLIAKIENYIVTDIPKPEEKPLPDERKIVEDYFTKILDIVFSKINRV